MFTGAQRMGAAIGLAFLGHGIWQMVRLSGDKKAQALNVFKSNTYAGAIIVIGLAIAALV